MVHGGTLKPVWSADTVTYCSHATSGVQGTRGGQTSINGVCVQVCPGCCLN